MIPSQKEEVFRIFDLVAEEKEDSFEALLSTIDVVAQEKIVRSWGEAAHLEQTNKIRILSVHIAHDFNRRR